MKRYRTSRSLSPPKPKNLMDSEQSICERCNHKCVEDKKEVPDLRDKAQQTKITHENQIQRSKEEQYRSAGGSRRPSLRQTYNTQGDTTNRTSRQTNVVCTKHEKEKVKMQTTIEKLQEAVCEKESKLQDTKSQLVRERRMSEILERQLKNARNLSEQLGRIIHDREQEIRSLKNVLNRKQDAKNAMDSAIQGAVLKAAAAARQADKKKIVSIREEFQAAMRRSTSGLEQSECNNLSSTSVDKMLKEIHSLIDGIRIKDEAIKGLQEECTRRLDKIQTLQRSLQILQEQLTQSSHHHFAVCDEKDNLITQLQHTLRETETTVESLLNEKTKVALEGENTIQELQEVIQQKDLVIKRVQTQLDESLEARESEVQQLKETLHSQQRQLEANEGAMESVKEELFLSMRECETARQEFLQEKCISNKMADEINCLVDRLTNSATEVENTKLEYQKKDERLITAQQKLKEMYMSFFGDHCLSEKLQTLYANKRELTGRRVLSEEDILQTLPYAGLRHGRQKCDFKSNKNISTFISSSQIHKQQLSELQQQVNESQTVCGILQEQLREVTDFLDQLLHIEISPKNMSALSLIRQYGKQLPTPSNMMSIARVTPEGVSSSSQLNLELTTQSAAAANETRQSYNVQCNPDIDYPAEANDDGNYELYGQREASVRNYAIMRSASAEDIRESEMDAYPIDPKSLTRTDTLSDTEKIIVLEATDSDEILLLLNGNMSNDPESRDAASKQRLSVNFLDCQDNSSTIERSISFGSFSDSALLSFERPPTDDRDKVTRRIASTEMLDFIPIPDPGQGIRVGSSESDIWSEPDRYLSRRRMGLESGENSASDESQPYVTEDGPRKKQPAVNRHGNAKNKTTLHISAKKNGQIMKHLVERFKTYLQVFEETNFNIREELDNFCDVREQITMRIPEKKFRNCDAILFDMAEYIRMNYILHKKLEKIIHYNKQLLEAIGGNLQSSKKNKKKESKGVRSIRSRKNSSKVEKKREKTRKVHTPPVRTFLLSEEKEREVDIPSAKIGIGKSIQSQLIGYHSTLISCQMMIKNLHTQLKERHCSEMMSKHELNRSVYTYLEDIDCCIDELCKKMETNTAENQGVCTFRSTIFNYSTTQREVREEESYSGVEVFATPLMNKLKENEDRILRFEILLNDKEKQVKTSTENALQLEVQLNSIKQSLYELQVENLELKECLEFSESKQLEMEGSSNQMLKELQATMQRLADLEERFRGLGEEHLLKKPVSTGNEQTSGYSDEYSFQGEQWKEANEDLCEDLLGNERVLEEGFDLDWEGERY